MNCPNCHKKPVGMFNSFRLGRVSLKKMMNGYFRCKHCGTLLQQPHEPGILPKYQKTFWYFYFLHIFLLLLTLWFFIFYLENNLWTIRLPAFFIILIILTGITDTYIRPRYWIIEEVDEEQKSKPKRRLTGQGWAAFISLLIGSFLLFLLLPDYVDLVQYNNFMVAGGIIVILVLLVAAANAIFENFSYEIEDTGVEGE